MSIHLRPFSAAPSASKGLHISSYESLDQSPDPAQVPGSPRSVSAPPHPAQQVPPQQQAAEKTKKLVVKITLSQGAVIHLPLKRKAQKELSEVYGQWKKSRPAADPIDLQKDPSEYTAQELPLIHEARRVLDQALSTTFRWNNRPAALRGSERGAIPYSQQVSNIPKLAWKLGAGKTSAETTVDRWIAHLGTVQLLMKRQIESSGHPMPHLNRDFHAIGQMMARLRKVHIGALDFEQEHPFDTTKDLDKEIETRKALALEWVKQNQSFLSRAHPKEEEDFAYDIALQGIPDRKTYEAACHKCQREPKQDTLELSLLTAQKQGIVEALATYPMASFLASLSGDTQKAIQDVFNPPAQAAPQPAVAPANAPP